MLSLKNLSLYINVAVQKYLEELDGLAAVGLRSTRHYEWGVCAPVALILTSLLHPPTLLPLSLQVGPSNWRQWDQGLAKFHLVPV